MIIIDERSFADYKMEPKLVEAINKFARHHMGRYPIRAWARNHDTVELRDERLHGANFPSSEIPLDALCGVVSLGWRGDSDDMFRLFSHSIENERYRNGSDKFYSVTTKSPDKIVDLMKKHIKPLEWSRLFAATKRRKDREHRDFRSKKGEVYRDAVRSVGMEPVPDQMMLALFKERERCSNFMDACLNDLTSEKVKGVFTEYRASFVNGKDECGVPVHIDSEGMAAWCRMNISSTAVDLKQAPAHMMPTAIQEQVSVLKMVAPDTFVIDTGYRAADDIYWVYGD